MSDRSTVSANVPADIAERISDQADEYTDAELDAAAAAIREDYLLLGYTYPRGGSREYVTAGEVVMRNTETCDLEELLTTIVSRNTNMRYEVVQTVETFAVEYLRKAHPLLVERMAEAMREEAKEDCE